MGLGNTNSLALVLAVAGTLASSGCSSMGGWGHRHDECAAESCTACPGEDCDGCDSGCCLGGHCLVGHWGSWGCHHRSLAIPEMYPLGAVNRAHYHQMQTNAEASEFILHRHEFVGETAELTPDGKDHIMEIGARMRSTPFPVLIERSENNSDPELDGFRRNLVAQILTDFGNTDAQQRTIVSPAYSKGLTGREGEGIYYQHHLNNGYGNGGNYGNNFNQGGTFGGGFGFGR